MLIFCCKCISGLDDMRLRAAELTTSNS